LDEIKYFFTHYKDLEENKFINVDDFIGSEEANVIYLNAAKTYKLA